MKQNLTTIKVFKKLVTKYSLSLCYFLLQEMQKKLQEGGFLIWIAPAGGRDRRKADGTLIPDKFDPQAIEMMKKLGTKKSAAKTHFYPLAMVNIVQ